MSPPNKFDDADDEADHHTADQQSAHTGRQEWEQGKDKGNSPDNPAEDCAEQLEDELQHRTDCAEKAVYYGIADLIQQLVPPRGAGTAARFAGLGRGDTAARIWG